jgi:hypothetical protein
LASNSSKSGHHALLDHRLEKRFLAVEIQVERALGDAGTRRHLIQTRGRKALLDEQGQGRRGKLGRAGLLATLTTDDFEGAHGGSPHNN